MNDEINEHYVHIFMMGIGNIEKRDTLGRFSILKSSYKY